MNTRSPRQIFPFVHHPWRESERKGRGGEGKILGRGTGEEEERGRRGEGERERRGEGREGGRGRGGERGRGRGRDGERQREKPRMEKWLEWVGVERRSQEVWEREKR
jgi:hypothetical protein